MIVPSLHLVVIRSMSFNDCHVDPGSIKMMVIGGGVPMPVLKKEVRENFPDVVIATPGGLVR